MSLNVLTFTTLYPNKKQPRHGIFVEQRIRHLKKTGHVSVNVVAPVPWFPFNSKRFGQYALYANVPASEERFGINVTHPKYVVIPKIGMLIAPLTLAISGYLHIKKRIKGGENLDVIDAHYYYPDGVAAALIGKWLKIPVVITARGSDINLIAKSALPRKMIQWAAKHAAANITVSAALKHEMEQLDIPANRIEVLRNGVDLETFHVMPDIRQQTTESFHIISVGNLIELKGHHLVIQAIKELDNVTLSIVGEGPKEMELKSLVTTLALQEKVKFLGYKTHQELAVLYNQADALVLASSREGMPNVLLEAMACGTPVISSPVGGAVEVITNEAAGVLLEERTVQGVTTAINQLVNKAFLPEETRRHSEQFSWDRIIKCLSGVYKRALKLDN